MKENKSLLKRYKEIRKTTETICKPLVKEDFVVQPITDVSPPKWHLGHTTWFFELFLLQKFSKNYQVFNSNFNYVFNSYYESAGDRMLRSNRGNLSRPDTEMVYNYRKFVDGGMKEWLSSGAHVSTEALNLLEIGINHEQQHQELLFTDIKYILGHNLLFPEYQVTSAKSKNNGYREEKFIEVPEGNYEVGYNGDGFSYDNETPEHRIYQAPFKIMDRLVTNGEFLEFMNNNGYKKHQLWLSDGWDWINKNNILAPHYWHKIDGKWHQYTLYGLKELDLNAPVSHVSYYEADAFASWKGKRLPTENEWEISFDKLYSQEAGYNLFNGFVNCPQPAQPGSTQVLGDVWEWTSSAYLPYPNYKKPRGAIGEYNGKFMINKMVLRGGSCATPQSHIRKTYRNFFQPDKRWQYTGIRLAEDIN